ncbi:MAG: phosphoadenylyl-sulfate reductase [Bacteroidales bacterium]|nr:phosphoadenylyl-sulfate reductase [Bacteroidales bacterium]
MELTNLKTEITGTDMALNLRRLAAHFPGQVVFTTSFGVEDQVITDVIFRNDIDIEVVAIDTGRMFEETYKVHSNTLKIYKKPIRVLFPDREEVEKLMTEKGPYSFYQSIDNRKECCHIRKVIPLGRALAGKRLWVTGIRAEQSNVRSAMEHLEYDETNRIMKYHPLFDWTLAEVEEYLKKNHVPHNELHYKGFVSIGCAPCTRAIKPGEDFRAGRWWWEDQSGKECGLHRKK